MGNIHFSIAKTFTKESRRRGERERYKYEKKERGGDKIVFEGL
jgi:hypothetical protein